MTIHLIAVMLVADCFAIIVAFTTSLTSVIMVAAVVASTIKAATVVAFDSTIFAFVITLNYFPYVASIPEESIVAFLILMPIELMAEVDLGEFTCIYLFL